MIRPAAFAALLSLVPAGAWAQVSVNPGALDQLKPAAPAPAGEANRPASRPAARPPAHHPAPTHTASRPAREPAPAPAKPKPVSVAPAPPPAAVLPVVPPEPRPAVPPPPAVPPVAGAEGAASAIPGGQRLTFGAGKTDMNVQAIGALQTLAAALKNEPAADVNVYAYAAGVPDDPSTPRRLSLGRALAVRSVLINGGIASTRIYVRALGATPSDGPPDRVDVIRVGTPEAKP